MAQLVDYRLFLKIAPQAKPEIISALVAPMNRWLPIYSITGALRLPHFLAQCALESDGFTTLVERGKPEYFDKYQGRKDLGNVQPGDGRKFKGRGIFQLTGRVNYDAYGRRLGEDLINHPELAATPELSVRIACEYWKAKGLNAWADRDDIKEITRKINGGYSQLPERQTYLARAKEALPPPAEPQEEPEPLPPVEEVPDAPIAPEPQKTPVQSKTIWSVIGQIFGSIGAGIAMVFSDWRIALVFIALIIVLAVIIGRDRIQRLFDEQFK